MVAPQSFRASPTITLRSSRQLVSLGLNVKQLCSQDDFRTVRQLLVGSLGTDGVQDAKRSNGNEAIRSRAIPETVAGFSALWVLWF
jgi:hypothetical protein